MRTVTYIGLLAIADAINKDWSNGAYTSVFAIILIIAVIMDMYDFIKDLTK